MIDQNEFVTSEDDGAMRYGVEFTPAERSVLRAGLHQWLGPARCTDVVAVIIGFPNWDDFRAQIGPLVAALERSQPLTGEDWRRILVSAEVSFGSDVLGSGVEWPTLTGMADVETLDVLRGLQRKLAAVVRGRGPGNSDYVRPIDQSV